jgi:SAM-dependent methyltransferase
MFALTPRDLWGKILDCASGPASLNAELTAEGHKVTSCDPLYSFTADEIRARIDATFDALVDNARVAYDEFLWRDIESPEHLGKVRMAAMQRFLADFPEGLKEGRYRPDALPHLGFDDDKFDLALCSAFLFTYTELLSLDFHVTAIEEMCRVASEARIFPLLKGYGGPSPYVEPVMNRLLDRGYTAAIREVPYEFQRGGNKMLAVKRPGTTATV